MAEGGMDVPMTGLRLTEVQGDTPGKGLVPSTDLSDTKGFPLSVVGEDADKKFTCSECHLLIRSPVQSTCGHRFCKVCLEGKSEETSPTCKLCVADGDDGVLERGRDNKVMTFPDRAIMREMRKLPARCHHEGCQWKGSFGDFLDHEASCKHRQVVCKECGVNVSRCKLKEHTDPEKGDCVKVKCPFGCEDNNTEKHLQQNVVKHSLMILDQISRVNSKHNGRGNPQSCSTQAIKGKVTELEGKVDTLSQQYGEFVKQGATVSIPNMAELKTLEEKNATTESIAAVLNREVETMITQIGALEHQRTLDRCNMETMEKKVRALERSMALKDVDLAEKQIRIDALENTSYDGTYVWRITDFRRRRQDAMNGRTLSIYSPPFNTGKAGYKVCARIYLNGDGMGKGTHISMFFVILKGLYDPILQWPFPHKVTFTLVDQTGREHLVDGFRPDPTSTSFRRPTSDMNIASGMPVFCPLSKIDQPNSPYTKEDTMFIRMKIFCDE